MKEKRIRFFFLHKFIPAVLMILIILALLLRFSAVSKGQEKERILSEFKSRADSSATQIETCLETAVKSADAISYCLENGNSDNALSVMQAVLNATEIQDIIVCDRDGSGYHADGSMLTAEEKEQFANAVMQERKIGYTDDTGSGFSTFFAVSPVETEEETVGHVICCLDPSKVEKQNIIKYFGKDSFYLLLDKEGMVALIESEEDSPFCVKTGNYIDKLSDIARNVSEVGTLRTKIETQTTYAGQFTDGNSVCTLIEAPVFEGEFFLIIGVPQERVDLLVKENWKPLQVIAWQILAAICIFVCILIVLNVLERIRDSEKNKALENKADTDLLTGLNNKIATERKIREHIAAHPDELALMFILDIDNFKNINDTMGHAFGDEVLKLLGQQISGEFRVSDIIGRTGGDEFIVFLCNMKEETIIQKEAGRMKRFFQNFQAGDYVKYSVTASIGAAVYPRDAQTFEGLYKAADRALYVAKKRGKNQLAFYGDEK